MQHGDRQMQTGFVQRFRNVPPPSGQIEHGEGDIVALNSRWHWGIVGLFAVLIAALALWASLTTYLLIRKLDEVVLPEIPVAKVQAPRRMTKGRP